MFSLIGISNTWTKPDKPIVFFFNPNLLQKLRGRVYNELTSKHVTLKPLLIRAENLFYVLFLAFLLCELKIKTKTEGACRLYSSVIGQTLKGMMGRPV